MKYVALIFAIALMIFAPLRASHFQFAHLTYESLSPTTVRIHLWAYQECTTFQPPQTFSFSPQITAPSNCNNPAPSGAQVNLPSVDVTPICPTLVNSCNNSSSWILYGVAEHHNYQDFDFTNATCADYEFYFSTCCRNPSITNVSSPSSASIYGSLNLNAAAVGQSSMNEWRQIAPHFLELPASGTDTLHFDLGINDPENDSIVYSLSAPLGSFGNPLSYNPGYSATTPMGTGTGYDLSLDPHTGFLQLIYSSSSNQVICSIGMTASEYRNGALIAVATREFTLSIVPNGAGVLAPSALPQHMGITSLSSGSSPAPDTAYIPSTGSTCIDYGFMAAAFGSPVESNGYYFGPGTFSFNDLNGTPTNPVYGSNSGQQFCFTPPGPGTYEFYVGLRDSTCNYTGMNIQKFVVIAGDTGLVWPGDANNDLVANNIDVLAVGLGGNSTGPVRANASSLWVGQPSQAWNDTIPGAIDKKYVDCDGNGVIDSLDLLPIAANYGLTHNKTSSANGTQTDPNLSLNFPADSFQVGDTVTVQINLGDVNINAQNVYGIAFTVLYDSSLIDTNTFSLDFSNSWIGTSPDVYTFQYDQWSMGRMDAAIVRNDQMVVSGMGMIAQATFVIIDNIDGKRHTLVTDTLDLRLGDVVLIGLDGKPMPLNWVDDSAIVFESILDQGVPVRHQLELYPNPATDLVYVQSEGELIHDMEVIDLQGKTIGRYAPESERYALSISELPAGVYFLRVTRDSGTEIRRLLKQ